MFDIGAIIALIIGFGFLIFVHELGHFLVAKWVGIKCTQFAIGFGPSVLAWRKGIGFCSGSTEPDYERRIAEFLKRSDEPTVSPSNASIPKDRKETKGLLDEYPSARVNEVTAELGLGETEYRINWLPLGGYVKMLGQEDLDPSMSSNDPRSFNSKPIWARSCVISAGVVMNLIFGLVFFVIAFMVGVQFPPAIVGAVAPGFPAATEYVQGHEGDPEYRGLQVGDRITHVAGKAIRDMMDVKAATMLSRKGSPLHFVIDRPHTGETLEYVLTAQPDATQENLLVVGIGPPQDVVVKQIIANSEPFAAGVRPGMRVIAINGATIDSFGQYYRQTIARHGQPVTVTFSDEAGRLIDVPMHAVPWLNDSNGISNLVGLVPAVKIAPTAADSPAAIAGVQDGDLVAMLGEKSWPDFDEIIKTIKNAKGNPINLIVQRADRQVGLDPITPVGGKIGIRLMRPRAPIVGKVLNDSPGSELGLVGGSRITAIEGQIVESWADMQRIMARLPAETDISDITVEYELNIAEHPVEQGAMTLAPDEVAMLSQAAWGAPDSVYFAGLLEPVVVRNPMAAISLGFGRTRQIVYQTYLSLLRVFQGSVEVRQLRGPVGIVHVGTKVAKQGATYFVFFLGLISISLAVINFLPLPIVDGGHIVFLLIEKVKGSPASPAVQIAAMWIGLALIGGIFLLVTYHDIARLVTG